MQKAFRTDITIRVALFGILVEATRKKATANLSRSDKQTTAIEVLNFIPNPIDSTQSVTDPGAGKVRTLAAELDCSSQ